MSAAETEAMIDAGLERCHACGFYDAPRKMLFNCDGSRWFCGSSADGEPPCSLEETPCKDCLQPKGNLDLDMDGSCGCVAEAAARAA